MNSIWESEGLRGRNSRGFSRIRQLRHPGERLIGDVPVHYNFRCACVDGCVAGSGWIGRIPGVKLDRGVGDPLGWTRGEYRTNFGSEDTMYFGY